MRNPDRSDTVTYFIDGTNLCYWQDTNRPTLHVLLELLIALKKEKNRSFYCIFDANTQYKLPPEERETYQHLLEFKDYFYQITGGKRADDFILELANSYDAPVISNDTYSDPKYAKYSWKERDFTPKRLFMGEVIPLRGDIHLIISELELHIWLQDTVHNAFKRFVRTIQPASSRHRGKVKFLNRQEGWGLIAYETDIYFHRAALLENIDEGMEVEFVTGTNDKGVCAEQIISGVNKRDGKPLVSGIVESYDEAKTIGTIKTDETGEMLFFYKSYIEDGVSVTLQKGMHVEFTISTNKNGACARNIRPAVIDENKYFNDKIAQLETLLKERDALVREKETQAKDKEVLLQQLKKQYEQNIQTANAAKNAAEKAMRQLQIANNEATRNVETPKHNTNNGQGNNNGNAKHTGANLHASNDKTNTNGSDNSNLPIKETAPLPTVKDSGDKQQQRYPQKNDAKQEQANSEQKNRNLPKLPEKQGHKSKQQTQNPVIEKVAATTEHVTTNITTNKNRETQPVTWETTIEQPTVITNSELNTDLPNNKTLAETTQTPAKNDDNTATTLKTTLLIEPKPDAGNNKNDRHKKTGKSKKENSQQDVAKVETTIADNKTTEKTANEFQKTHLNAEIVEIKGKANADNPTPIQDTATDNSTETAPAIVKQVITADYFDTPIKRKQWWASLQPQWKKAFNVLVGKGEVTDLPDDVQLKQIFDTEKLNFKLAKNKLSFQLSNLSGVQYLSNLLSLNVSEQAISDLKGTERLTKLTHFNCSKNRLNSLEGIEQFRSLEEFICSNNQLNANAFENIATLLPQLRSLDCKHNLLSKEECAYLKRTGGIKDLKV